MLREYTAIREDILRANPELTPVSLDTLSGAAFEDTYSISYEKAADIHHEGQWSRWLSKHNSKTDYVFSTQLKALEDEQHGRYVTFDLITSDIDQSSNAPDQEYDDLITPEAISRVKTQLKGSVINMIDPADTKDFTELWQDAKFGGVGHEHILKSKDIVPALIIDDVDTKKGNSILTVTAKINEYTQRANDVWSMIKNGTLRGASIEYKELPDKISYKKVGDRIVRVLDDIVLSGFTITSKMRNDACKITGWMVKALPETTSLSPVVQKVDSKMAIEVKETAEAVVAPVAVAPEQPDMMKALLDEMKCLKETVASQKVEMDSMKALQQDKAMVDQFKDVIKEEIKSALEPSMKALVEPEQEKFDITPIRDSIKAAIAKGDGWEVARQKHNELASKGLIV